MIRLPAVVSALNNEVTRLTGKKAAEAIKGKTVAAKPSTPYLRPVGMNEKKLPSTMSVPGRRTGRRSQTCHRSGLVSKGLQH